MTKKSIDPKHIALNALRNQLLAKGYTPLPCRGKVPTIKKWNSENYASSQITASAKGPAKDRIDSWTRRFAESETTGIRIERRLLVGDFDTDDQGAVDACLAALGAISTDWDRAPSRYGGGQFKLAVFGQVLGELFVRVGSNKYRRPGDPDDVYHGIELFGGKPFHSGVCSRQFAIYGPRSYAADGTVESSYVWAEGLPALHEVTVDQLPGMTREQALGVVDAFEAYAVAQGWTLVEEDDDSDGQGSNIYDIDRESSKFEVRGEGVASYAELEEMVFNRADLRVSASFIEGETTTTPDRCSVYLSKRYGDCLCILDWKTNSRHFPKDKAPLIDEAKKKIASTVAALLADAQKAAEGAATAGEKSGDDDDGATAAPPKMPPRPRNMTAEERIVKDNDLRGTLIGERVLWLLMTHALEDGNVVNVYMPGRNSKGISERAARSTYLNWSITREGEGARGGKLPPIAAFDIWLGDQYRMETAGIQMRPDRAYPTFVENGQTWRNRYQAPRHWEVRVTDAQIAEAGELYRGLIGNIAAALPEQAYVLQHVAYKMLHPEVPGCGLLFVNPVFGSGRDLFFEISAALLGMANCTKQDVGKLIGSDGRVFNAWVANKILTFVPEVLDPEHTRGSYEKLKNLVDPRSGLVSVNSKGIEEFDALRFSTVWAATNHSDALRLEDEDRRFSVLLGKMQALPQPLAIKLEKWRVQPTAMPALWRYLKTIDLTGYLPYVPLVTTAKLNMIEATKDPVRRALQAIAEDDRRVWKTFTLDQLESAVETFMGIGSSTRPDRTRNLTSRHKAARANIVVPVPSADGTGLRLRLQGKQERIYCFQKDLKAVERMTSEQVYFVMKNGPAEMEKLRNLSEEAAKKKQDTTSENNVFRYPEGGQFE